MATPMSVFSIHKLNPNGKVSIPKANIKEEAFALAVVITLPVSIANTARKVISAHWTLVRSEF